MKRRAMLAGSAALSSLALPWVRRSDAAAPIKVGLLEDVSGDLAMFGIPKLHGSQLAVEEVNAGGGVLGRPLELIHLDPQGDNARYQEFARRLLQRDKVDVLIGGITSASREAIRPIVDRQKTLYFYTNQYEGGVCDASMISVGAVPEQQLSTLIPWMVEKFGKRVYTVAADYNFGHLSAEWGRSILKPLGGEVVGEEFIPLGVS
ncbi:MAG: transporter substrate-binding protein, partial [Acetobacteraceae bacterium]|nr:transporter substrate-binding protein [Acetobacteraceae bacterium]